MIDSINIHELKGVTDYILKNNLILEKENKKTTAIEIVGESGIGKTSAILQLAKELNLQCVKLNLAQIEELGDLVGFPIKEYEMCSPTGDCAWVEEKLIDQYARIGYTVLVGKKARMSYAPPAWLPDESSTGGILMLDDWNRADPRFTQAVMELVDRGEYISWKLPPNWSIVLTANPDNGDYAVQSLDNAQRTRYISFDLEFDKDVWAEWAEKEGIDGRCINFVLLYPELLKKEGGIQKVNARSLVTFFNTIQGLPNFNTPENLGLILQIAGGCFSDKENTIGNIFTTFINNKLDKLIQPEKILHGKWSEVSKEIRSNTGDSESETYRSDIAATLTIRFINHLLNYLEEPESDGNVVVNRVLDIVNNDKQLLTMDLIFTLVKKLVSKDRRRMSKLLTNPKLTKIILS